MWQRKAIGLGVDAPLASITFRLARREPPTPSVRPNDTEQRSERVDRLDDLLDQRGVLRVAWCDFAGRHLNLRKEPFRVS